MRSCHNQYPRAVGTYKFVNKGFGVYGHAAEYITGGDILSGWINVDGYVFTDITCRMHINIQHIRA